MIELCILFQHHRVNPVIEAHLQLIKKFNPGVPVIPISFNPKEKLPETVDVTEYDGKWQIGPRAKEVWIAGDAVFFRWFEKYRELEAKQYVVLEWDAFVNRISVREFYDSVWDCDLAGSKIVNPEEGWPWWGRHLRLIKDGKTCWSEKYKKEMPMVYFAKGVVPFCGTMISHVAASCIVDSPYYFYGANAELRLPTLANIHGFKLGQLWTGNWGDYRREFSLLDRGEFTPERCQEPGIYHKVKKLYPGLQDALLESADGRPQ